MLNTITNNETAATIDQTELWKLFLKTEVHRGKKKRACTYIPESTCGDLVEQAEQLASELVSISEGNSSPSDCNAEEFLDLAEGLSTDLQMITTDFRKFMAEHFVEGSAGVNCCSDDARYHVPTNRAETGGTLAI